MKARFLAALAALLLWASAASAQVPGTWPMANEPCGPILHPSTPADLPQVRDLLRRAEAALTALPESATEADRAVVRALFQRIHELSGGEPQALYAHAYALRRFRALEQSRRIYTCMHGETDTDPQRVVFNGYPQWLREGVVAAIAALDRDIEAALVVAQQRPGPGPSVSPPVGPDPRRVTPPPGPQIVGPVVTLRPTPHPRSRVLRTVGQVTVGVGAAATLTGIALTVLCYADAFGDAAYGNEANAGATHGWSDSRIARTQTICDVGGGLLAAGPLLLAAGVVEWRVGGQQVIDPPPATLPRPPRRAALGLLPDRLAFAPTEGGARALLGWHF